MEMLNLQHKEKSDSSSDKPPPLGFGTQSLKVWQRMFTNYFCSKYHNVAAQEVTAHVFQGRKPYYSELSDIKYIVQAAAYQSHASLMAIELINCLAPEIGDKIMADPDYDLLVDTPRINKLWKLIKATYERVDTESSRTIKAAQCLRNFSSILHQDGSSITEFNKVYLNAKSELSLAQLTIKHSEMSEEEFYIGDYVSRLSGTIGEKVCESYHGNTLPKTLHEVVKYTANISRSMNNRQISVPVYSATSSEPPKQKPWKKRKFQKRGHQEKESISKPEKRTRVQKLEIKKTFDNDSTKAIVEIDSGSAVHLIGDRRLLSNVRSISPITISGVGGDISVSETGTFGGYGDVLVGTNPRLNLLSLRVLAFTHRVHYDQESESYTVTDRSTNQELVYGDVCIGSQQYHYARAFDVSPTKLEVKSTKTKIAQDVRAWHNVLGHPSDEVMKAMLRDRTHSNIPFSVRDIDLCSDILGPCIACSQGKATRNKKNNVSNPEVDGIGKHVSIDIMFIKGRPYMVSIDEFSKYALVKTMFDKSAKAVKEAIDDFRNQYSIHGHRIRLLRSDRESAVSSQEFKEYLAGAAMATSLTASEGHAVSGERLIRTIKERMRAILCSLPYELPDHLYPYLIGHIVACLNLTPHAGTNGDAPVYLFTNTKPIFSNIPNVSFGDVVAATEPYASNKPCEQPKAKVGIVLGIDPNSPKSFFFRPFSDGLVVRRAHYKKVNSKTALNFYPKNPDYFEELVPDSDEETPEPTNSEEAPTIESEGVDSSDKPEAEDDIVKENAQQTDRPKRARKPSLKCRKLSMKDAIKQYPDAANEAIRQELKQMLDYDVFVPVTKATAKVMPSSLFIKEKYTASGEFDKIKARLVAGGHRETYDQNNKKYAPVVNPLTSALMLNIANHYGDDIEVWDVRCAFLNAKMDREDLFMRLQPDAARIMIKLKPNWNSYLQPDQSMIVKLKKALYGTKEAARLWYESIKTTMMEFGLKQSATDECLFYDVNKDNRLIIGTHVDDILVIGNDKQKIEELKQHITMTYRDISVQNQENLNYLGTTIRRNKKSKKIEINQSAYIDTLLKSRKPERRCETNPCSSNLLKTDDSQQLKPEDHKIYRSTVMKLMYLSAKSRPDIAFAINFLATKCHRPTQKHKKELDHLLAYLQHTKDLGITFTASENLNVHVFADASHCVHPDTKAQTGFAIFIGNNSAPIFAKSKKQSVLTESTTESELVALHSSLYLAIFATEIMKELKLSDRVNFYQDNAAVMHIVKSSDPSRNKSRSIKIKIEKTRETLKLMGANLVQLKTTEMVADILTKNMPTSTFIDLRHDILGKKVITNSCVLCCNSGKDMNIKHR